ncbi:MAG: hypothetical protein K5675_00285, partial [Lachnospiraceae bacterium]|nr:hypothetical protein [Lachnospiraceae bacterium]
MKKTVINNGWLFSKAEGKKYEENVDVTSIDWKRAKEVILPHTWFKEEDQYRGLTYYKKELTIDYKEDEVYYIEFEGADQRCKVYCNETYLGEHKGAYATFRFMLPDEDVSQGQVTITVLLDNSNCDEVSPMFGDFTVFGGLFRNVSILSAKKNHFDYLYFGTKGLILRTRVEDNKGIIEVEPHTVTEKEGTICYQVFDESNECIVELEEKENQNAVLCVNDVKLWNGRKDVNLYCVKASLKVDEKVWDEVSLTTGFKNFSMDPDHGAFLNGEHLKLKGVAKHEDFGSKHNAVTKKEIEKDFELISEIGANAVRLSHYQHPQETYDICDKEGYLVWAEIP